MKTLRCMLSLMIVLTIVGLAADSRAEAKGPVDKVTISGPGLEEPIEITDTKTTEFLSMAMLEDFGRHIVAPDRLGPGYELTRSFRLENGSYQPFDRVAYYPDLYGGSGYVNYIGIDNGWSEYDGQWFRAQDKGDKILRQILFEHDVLLPANLLPVEQYLAVTGTNGTLRLLDAATLEDAALLHLGDEALSLHGVVNSLDGQRLYVATSNGTGTIDQRVLNLASASENCLVAEARRALTLTPGGEGLVLENGDTLEIRGAETLELLSSVSLPEDAPPAGREFYPSPDRRWLYMLAYDLGKQATLYPLDLNTGEFADPVSLDVPPADADFVGQWEAGGQRFHLLYGDRLYTFNARDRMIAVSRTFFQRGDQAIKLADVKGALGIADAREEMVTLYDSTGPDGGVFSIEILTGKQRQLWQPERIFSQVIADGERLYGVQNGTQELVALDASSGEVVATRSLEVGEQLDTLIWLSPEVVASSAALTLACAPHS